MNIQNKPPFKQSNNDPQNEKDKSHLGVNESWLRRIKNMIKSIPDNKIIATIISKLTISPERTFF